MDRKLDSRSDVWATCLVMWAVMTGNTETPTWPYRQGDTEAHTTVHEQRIREAFRKDAGEYPSDTWVAIFHKCLAMDPDHRWTPTQLHAAVEAEEHGKPWAE